MDSYEKNFIHGPQRIKLSTLVILHIFLQQHHQVDSFLSEMFIQAFFSTQDEM